MPAPAASNTARNRDSLLAAEISGVGILSDNARRLAQTATPVNGAIKSRVMRQRGRDGFRRSAPFMALQCPPTTMTQEPSTPLVDAVAEAAPHAGPRSAENPADADALQSRNRRAFGWR